MLEGHGSCRSMWGQLVPLGLLGLSLGACATTSAKMDLIRQRAAFDLSCNESIEVVDIGNEKTFGATGCDRRASYVVVCVNAYASSCTAIMNSDEEPADSVAAGRPAKSTSEPAADDTEGSAPGVVARTVPLVGSSELRLVGRPSENGGQVLVRMSLLGKSPGELGSWDECKNAEIIANEQTFSVIAVKVGSSGYASAPSMVGRARVGQLIRLVRAEDEAGISVCGQKSDLDDAGREVLLEFLKEFRKVAREKGTWDPSLGDESKSDAASSEQASSEDDQATGEARDADAD